MEIDLDVPMESVRCGYLPVSCGTASVMQDVLRSDAMSDGMAGVGPAKRRARHLQSLNQGLQLKLQTHRSLLRGFIVRSQPSSQDKVIRSHTHSKQRIQPVSLPVVLSPANADKFHEVSPENNYRISYWWCVHLICQEPEAP